MEFWIAGGSADFGKLIGTATLTLYGWLYDWNTTTVPNGPYYLLSYASNSSGSTWSSAVAITVDS